MSQVEHLPSLEAREGPRWRRYLIDSILAITGTLFITAIIYTLHLYPTIPDISLAYLLIVLALAGTRGLYAAVLSALVAFFSFDYFLVPPLYTFTIGRFEEWLALFDFTSQCASGRPAGKASVRRGGNRFMGNDAGSSCGVARCFVGSPTVNQFCAARYCA